MVTYRIVFDRQRCLGTGACEAMAKTLRRLQEEGFANLETAIFNKLTGAYEVEVDECALRTDGLCTESCPSGCVRFEKR